jgi:hypothetical protein
MCRPASAPQGVPAAGDICEAQACGSFRRTRAQLADGTIHDATRAERTWPTWGYLRRGTDRRGKNAVKLYVDILNCKYKMEKLRNLSARGDGKL